MCLQDSSFGGVRKGMVPEGNQWMVDEIVVNCFNWVLDQVKTNRTKYLLCFGSLGAKTMVGPEVFEDLFFFFHRPLDGWFGPNGPQSRYNREVYEWMSKYTGLCKFLRDRAQSHETSQTQSPLKLHRAGLNPSKYTQYWNPGV